MAAAAAAAEVDAVLDVCGIGDAVQRLRIVQNEGFGTLADFGLMDGDHDVVDMAKRLAGRPAATRVNLGTVQIKALQALVWWIHDRQTHGQALVGAEWTQAALTAARQSKRIDKEREKTDASVGDLVKFDPDIFETCEDAFKNLLAQKIGVAKVSLLYVVRARVVPAAFVDATEERLYQLQLAGAAFETDNRTVFRLLKEYLNNTAGWAWIEAFNDTEDGRDAFWAWADHYNGAGELSKRTELAKASIKTLHYKSETAMPFETFSEKLTRAMAVLDKDEQEKLKSQA